MRATSGEDGGEVRPRGADQEEQMKRDKDVAGVAMVVGLGLLALGILLAGRRARRLD